MLREVERAWTGVHTTAHVSNASCASCVLRAGVRMNSEASSGRKNRGGTRAPGGSESRSILAAWWAPTCRRRAREACIAVTTKRQVGGESHRAVTLMIDALTGQWGAYKLHGQLSEESSTLLPSQRQLSPHAVSPRGLPNFHSNWQLREQVVPNTIGAPIT